MMVEVGLPVEREAYGEETEKLMRVEEGILGKTSSLVVSVAFVVSRMRQSNQAASKGRTTGRDADWL